MKANEVEDGKVLMIGDLVVGCIETDIVDEATYKIPCKVTDINHYGDVICEALKPFPDELDWQDGDDFSWIEPIPLTAEILEKNGFSSNYAEDDLSYIECRGDIVGIHIVGKYGFMDEMYFDYVHQLQHAIRLCGIDKEIIL